MQNNILRSGFRKQLKRFDFVIEKCFLSLISKGQARRALLSFIKSEKLRAWAQYAVYPATEIAICRG